jgi:hypothetical protein
MRSSSTWTLWPTDGRRRHRRNHDAIEEAAFIPETALLRGAAVRRVAERHLGTIRDITRHARALKVVGLRNVLRDQDFTVYVLEVNPDRRGRCPTFRDWRPMAKIAARWRRAARLPSWSRRDLVAAGVFVKSPVFPRPLPRRRHDPGPEMKSTGEVMGGP